MNYFVERDVMKKIIITNSLLCLFILYMLEQILMTPYIIKTIIKFPMFTLFPFLIRHYLLKSKSTIVIKKSEQRFILVWSVFIFVLVFTLALALKSFIDIRSISSDFTNRMQLGNRNMVLAAVYTVFINSFIEEYFFRGFIFQNLLKQGWNKTAFILSSTAFAVYHISVFKAWFNPGFMMLILFGLFSGGLIFAYFVKKTESILASWFIHLSADLALIVYGFLVLDLLTWV